MVVRYNPTVQPRPVAQTRFRLTTTPETFGAAEGRAMQTMGAGLLDVSEAMGLRQQLEKDAERRQQQEAYRGDIRQLSYDAEQGYFAKTGTQALGDNRQSYAERLEEARNRRAAQLTGAERERFMRETSDMTMSALDRATQHEAQQSRETVTKSFEATVNGFAEDALLAWNDDRNFQFNMDKAVEAELQAAAIMGLPQEVMSELRRARISELQRSRAILMADQDPTAAMEYIEAVGDQLTSEHRRELETNLEPLVRQHRVDRYMQQFMVPAGQTPQGNTPGMPGYRAAVANAESGGGRNMRNPNGTAQGWYGFTDGTWIAEIDRMRRAGVLPPEMQGMTHQQIMDARHDERLSGIVHDFWAETNANMLRQRGLPVDNVTMYTVHHFGRGAGPALVAASRSNPSKLASEVYRENGWNWSGVVAANPWVKNGMTVGELMAGTAGHIGRAAGFAPRLQFDAASAYAFATTIEDLEEREAFIKAVEAREALIQRQRGAAQAQVMNDATEAYLENGETSLSLEQQMRLGLDGVNTFRDMVYKHQTGSLTTDPSVFTALSDMMASQDPRRLAEFAEENSLEKFADRLSLEDMRYFTQQRSRIRGELEGQQLTKEQIAANPGMAIRIESEHRTDIDRTLEAMGTSESNKPQHRMLMERQLRQRMLDFYNREGRVPVQHEWQQMLDALVLPTNQREGTLGFGGQIPLFRGDAFGDGSQVEIEVAYANVPASERERITAALTAATGRVPTRDEVARYYEDLTLNRGGMGMQPLDADMVPPEHMRFLLSQGKSSESIAQYWQEYVMGVISGDINPMEVPFSDAELDPAAMFEVPRPSPAAPPPGAEDAEAAPVREPVLDAEGEAYELPGPANWQ